MSARICPGWWLGLTVGTLVGFVSACGGGSHDAPPSDAGPADARPADGGDASTTPGWPVPSDFPADGPAQPGEGDTCQLSVQCSNERQICVDDACVREERVTSAGLVFGDWRVLTPAEVRATTALAGAVAVSYLRTVLDEHGEITVVGYVGTTSGATAIFTIGARTRLVELSSGLSASEFTLLPLGDGFLSESGFYASYIGPGGTVEWSAGATLGTRAPLPPEGTLPAVQSMIHTPEGPVMLFAFKQAFGGEEWYGLELQRLDLASREFVPVDFADGPYLVDRVLGHAAMGPTGLELIVGERTPDEQLGRFSVHSVATGADRSLGAEPRPWEVDVRPASSSRWVAVLLRDSLASPCYSLGFTSESDDSVARLLVNSSDIYLGICENASTPRRVTDWYGPQFSPAPPPAAWIHSDRTELFAATSDGTHFQSFGSDAGGPVAIAARFGKTFEFVASGTSDPDSGLTVAERSLQRAGGI